MSKKLVLMSILTLAILISIAGFSCAATWYDESYNWARNNGIIASKNASQLQENISAKDFYAGFFKYLDTIGVPERKSFTKSEDYKSDNYILVSVDRQLTRLVEKNWLTIEEYKNGAKLVDNAQNILARNEKYFSATEKENISYYLEVMDYLLYSKIYDANFKSLIAVKKPANVDKFIQYKLIPYYGDFSREEFINLLYNYKAGNDTNWDIKRAVAAFVKKDVLQGYDNNLMLTVKLNYAHFVTFLYRAKDVVIIDEVQEDLEMVEAKG